MKLLIVVLAVLLFSLPGQSLGPQASSQQLLRFAIEPVQHAVDETQHDTYPISMAQAERQLSESHQGVRKTASWASAGAAQALRSEMATGLTSYANGALFSVNMQIGSPPSAFRMLVDTTSTQIAVPSGPLCARSDVDNNCNPNAEARYDPLRSLASVTVSCTDACEECVVVDE